jgi:hypothetical protein
MQLLKVLVFVEGVRHVGLDSVLLIRDISSMSGLDGIFHHCDNIKDLRRLFVVR